MPRQNSKSPRRDWEYIARRSILITLKIMPTMWTQERLILVSEVQFSRLSLKWTQALA